MGKRERKKYKKVRVVIEYKLEVSDEMPLNLKEEKLQWKTVAEFDCDLYKPKVKSVEEIQ